MNKAQLIDELASRFEGNKKNAQQALEAVIDTITRAVAKGEKVAITGFGVFEKIERPARFARNPATGERVRVKKTSVPRFKPGTGFRDVVSGARKLPKIAADTAKRTADSAKRTAAGVTGRGGSAATAAKRATATPKSTAARPAAKSTAAKKTAAKSVPAKKTAAKKTAANKSTATKSTARRTAAGSAANTPSTAKRAAVKRTTAR